MTLRKLQRPGVWFMVLAVLILTGDGVLTHWISRNTIGISNQDELVIYAVLVDFMLVIPVAYWFLVLRRQGKSMTKILPLPILGAGIAWLVLPVSMRGQIWNAAWPVELVIISAEVAFIGYELRLLYRLIRSVRQYNREQAYDAGEALRAGIREVMGESKLGSVIQGDLSMIYYLFFSWKRKAVSAKDGQQEAAFTYHKNTNLMLYSAIFTKVLVIEGVLVHLLVQQWSHPAAWIMSLMSLWVVAWIWGDCRSAALQPIQVQERQVRIRYGLRIQADIRYASIADVESSREYTPDSQEQKVSAMPVLGTPNVKLTFKEPVTVQGLLFLPRKVSQVYLAVDEPALLADAIRSKIGNSDRMSEGCSGIHLY